jgi:hypothetical protein
MPLIPTLSRFPYLRKLSALVLVALIAWCSNACAPPDVRDLTLEQDVVDNLPREHALSFLQSLVLVLTPAVTAACVFQTDGVHRVDRKGKLLRGTYPYEAFYARIRRPGISLVVTLYGPNASKEWCEIAAESNAVRQGKTASAFTARILTALLSMGTRVNSYGGSPVAAKRRMP